MTFQGKAIVVTGGASGIGLAAVKKLLAAGATVHIIDRANKIPDDLVGQSNLFFYPCVDVSSRASLSQTFTAISKRSPTLHGLLNSAGIADAGPASCDSDKVMEKVMAVNFTGTWNASTEFFKYAAKVDRQHVAGVPRDAGSCVVNMASVAGLKGLPNASAYCASKHAVVGLTRTMAIEWAPLGIRVNALAPGYVDTPMTQNHVMTLPARMSKATMAAVLQADEIADQVLFLMSPQSSGFAGNIMEVTGGFKRASRARL